ncbi:MAG: hypothetical protein GY795_11545 [Desulfobacterales bacterium]|nr:hypothetical protein [Desulfobacterales bacterium]
MNINEIIIKAMAKNLNPITDENDNIVAKKCRCGKFGPLFKNGTYMYIGCKECSKFTKFTGTVYNCRRKKSKPIDIEGVKKILAEKDMMPTMKGNTFECGKCLVCGVVGIKAEDLKGNTYIYCHKKGHISIVGDIVEE